MNVSEAPIFGKKADRADCTPAFDSVCLAFAVAICGLAIAAIEIASSKESLGEAALWLSNGNTPATAKAIAQMSFNVDTGFRGEKEGGTFRWDALPAAFWLPLCGLFNTHRSGCCSVEIVKVFPGLFRRAPADQVA